MKFASLSTFLALLAVSDAFWRMPCRSRSGLARLDPLVTPGELAEHAHAVHGGSGFGLTATYDDLRGSNCTSCGVYQDTSAYWTPSLHFVYSNGTAVIVPQVGGMLAYYLLLGENIQAFPAGFRMLSGDSLQRNFTWPVPDPPKSSWAGAQASQFALSQKALGFNCLNYGKTPEPSLYRHSMPDKDFLDANCVDGVRLELMFPSCWNGKDLDSEDHKQHVAFSSLVMDGTCPEGFEARIPSLFFETIWNTAAFAGEAGQFVLANGDPTGYGYHGDFISGWDVPTLQKAVNTCTNLSGEVSDCAVFDLQDDDSAQQCLFDMPSQLEHDDCAGPSNGLCGNVSVQAGPGYATRATCSSLAVPLMTSHKPMPMSTKARVVAPATPTVLPVNAAATATAPPVEAPATTAAPTLETPDSVRLVATSIYTTGDVVFNVVVEEEDVVTTVVEDVVTTVVVDAPPQRRHVHHRHRHN